MTKEAVIELSNLLDELVVANTEYAKADADATVARSREVQASNKLNALQKKVDEIMKKSRAIAPYNSMWKREERETQ